MTPTNDAPGDAEVARLRTALERCVQALETCDVNGEPHPTHDAVVAGLAKVCGSGGMLRAVVHEWRRSLIAQGITADNFHTIGPTYYALKGALRVGRAALGVKPDAD